MAPQVVVGVDGTPESAAAVAWAADEAALRRVPLCVMHVEEWTATRKVPRECARSLAGRSTALLHDAVRLARQDHPDLPVTTRCAVGRPGPALRGAADEAELAVLGSRGLGPVAALLLGSVSRDVAGRAGQPVALVRARGVRVRPSGGTGVVLGLDPAAPADRLLRFGFAEAARRGGALRVLYVIGAPAAYGTPYGGTSRPGDGRRHRAAAEHLAERLAPWRRTYPGVDVIGEVLSGAPAARLVRAAAGAELLAVGRRSRRLPLGPHLGEVARAVVRHSTVPVTVVPLG
ncbi:universal stress protein [Streptomyces sp. NPDC012888]|uniref:universal stress protein n=1 Tax=Streptomyces sp. NPDC012888 TaxID=3364855 RepID=UPI0036CECE03